VPYFCCRLNSAHQENTARNRRFGSIASFRPPAGHFRSAPNSGHSQRPFACVKRANKGSDLIDHLISDREDLIRYSYAKRTRGFEVDHQIDLAGLHDWQVARLFAFEDATNILAYLLIGI
jgi:hypothetical protein